jgi:hypothetical protein
MRGQAVELFSNMRDVTGSASILEQGVPCRAVIVQSQPLGMRNQQGDDMYAFVLAITADAIPAYETEVGSPVPHAARRLVRPGSAVPAKRLPDGDERDIAIDWAAALARTEPTAAA